MAPCLAPVFKGVYSPPTGGNIIVLIAKAIAMAIPGAVVCVLGGLFILLMWLFWAALSPFSAVANCKRKQAMFRFRHCVFGNSDASIAL